MQINQMTQQYGTFEIHSSFSISATGYNLVTKAKRFGYLPANYDSYDQLCANADEKLFFNVRYNPNHLLHQLLPSAKCSGYNLRLRRHNYTLPNNNTTLISNNFINRMLFADMYCTDMY